MQREAGSRGAPPSWDLLSATFPSLGEAEKRGKKGRPLVEALAHSSCPVGTGGEALPGKSYLGPVGPAPDLLHDALVGQPVVQS